MNEELKEIATSPCARAYLYVKSGPETPCEECGRPCGDHAFALKTLREADHQTDKLFAEIGRLKGLIKRVEQTDNDFGTLFCPWCGEGHKPDCPAFNPDGSVR